MKKFLLHIVFIFLISFIFSFFIFNFSKLEERNTRRFYKTVPVVITDIDLTWAFKGSLKWSVKFKSDEYAIEGIEDVTNWDSIGNNIRKGILKEGDTIQAKMWTIKQDENITNRYFSHLIK